MIMTKEKGGKGSNAICLYSYFRYRVIEENRREHTKRISVGSKRNIASKNNSSKEEV